MNNIPRSLRNKMALDPFYRVCCLTGAYGTPEDPVQWHHNLIFAHKQVQATFAILPVRKSLHDSVSNPIVKERLDWIMLNRASTKEIIKYSKVVDLARRLTYLNDIFGRWHEEAYAPELV